MHLPNPAALLVFEAAARLQSFKRAAAELHITATAVSHRIRKLEETLGCSLFIRETRAVRLSPEGHILYAAAAEGFALIAAATAQIRAPARQSVTLSVTPEFAALWLVPKLAAFRQACPDTDLHIHSAYTPVDLHKGEADIAIRYGSGTFAGIEAQKLLHEHFAPVAAPALADKLPADPRLWPLIHFDWHIRQALDWAAWAQSTGIAPQDMRHGFRYSNGTHAVQAALTGQGVALIGTALLADELRRGVLKTVSEHTLDAEHYWICTAENRPQSAAVQRVKHWLHEAAAQPGAQ